MIAYHAVNNWCFSMNSVAEYLGKPLYPITGQTVIPELMAMITAPLRFMGTKCLNWRKIMHHLTPRPKMQFYSTCATTFKETDPKYCFREGDKKLFINSRTNKETFRSIANCICMTRGQNSPLYYERQLHEYQMENPVEFIDWGNSSFYVDCIDLPKDPEPRKYDLGTCMMMNTSAIRVHIKNVWIANKEAFDLQLGLEPYLKLLNEDEFKDAIDNLSVVMDLYAEMDTDPVLIDEDDVGATERAAEPNDEKLSTK